MELGIALAGQGDVDAGRAQLQEAIEHLVASVGADATPTKRAKAHLARL